MVQPSFKDVDGPALPSLDLAALYLRLGTSGDGLTPAAAQERLALYGLNVLETVRSGRFLPKFLANFTHLMAILLWAAGIVAVLGRLLELAVAIWSLNLINGLFSAWQEYKAENAIHALRRLLPRTATVIRETSETRIPAEQLVPGDILVLREGDFVSADARVIEESGLRVDQSALTGESGPVRKTSEPHHDSETALGEFPSIVFAGTCVIAGSGRALVFRTGMQTEFGRIAHLTQVLSQETSPLQQELVHVTRTVTLIALAAGFTCFALATLLGTLPLADSFLFSLGMVVAFVPEGLLPTMTLSLAMGVQRMARRNVLVKRLSAIETLGCTTVICADKTGTLTKNEMTVRAFWTPDHAYGVSGEGYSPSGQILEDGTPVTLPDSGLRELLRAGSLCNDARLTAAGDGEWRPLGDPTEVALQVAAVKAGLDPENEVSVSPRVAEIGFDSLRKRMTTIHSDGRLAYMKGAPREVLALSTHVLRSGEPEILGAPYRASVLAIYDEIARRGLRVLGVARRTVERDLRARPSSEVERDFTFLGLVAMHDPPRTGVTAAIAACRRAGIRVVMLTGDYGLTAEAISRQIGLIGPGPTQVVNGVDIERMTPAELQNTLRGDAIIARATPEHKLKVVQAFQALGHIVAVTGDGVNDAPALKKAQIGIAMGGRGTDVAREAADLILTDDNFASIVHAIEEGRAVYSNIKKFITYICTSNAPEAAPFICFAFSGGRIPLALNIMQILSIDLGTDMAPALALGAEPPEPGIMEQPPRSLSAHLFSPALLARSYLILGLPQSLLVMAAFYLGYWLNGYWGQWLDLPAGGHVHRIASSFALAAVIATQIGNLFAQRSERTSIRVVGLRGNPLIWMGIASEVAFLLALLYVPPLQRIFGTSPLPAVWFGFLLAAVPVLPLIDELRKCLAARGKPRFGGPVARNDE